MKPNICLDKFLNSSMLSTSIFLTSGCYKTYKDYKNADEKYKDKFLVKDCVILSGAAMGMLINQNTANRIIKSKAYNDFASNLSKKIKRKNLNSKVKNSIQYTAEIIKDLSSGFMQTASGIAGALGMDYLLSKTKFEQPEYKHREQHKTKFENYLDKNSIKLSDPNTQYVFYTSVSDLPVMKFLSPGMVGIQSIELAKDKEFDKRLKHTTGYLVNETLVPLAFLSISSALTKKIKPVYRIPIIFSSLFFGTLGVQKIFDKKISSEN